MGKTFDTRLTEIETKLDTLDASVLSLAPTLPTPVSETAAAAVLKEYEIPASKKFIPTEISAKNFAEIPGTPASGLSILDLDNALTDRGSSPSTWTNSGSFSADSKFGSHAIAGYLKAGATTDFDALPSGDFTLEGWFKFDTYLSNIILMSKGTTSGTGTFLYLQTHGSGTYFEFIKLFFGGSYQINVSAVAITTGTYHHIAVVKDSTSVRLYLNGNKIGEVLSGAPTFNSAIYFTFGVAGDDYSSFTIEGKGKIDETRISNVAHYTGNSFSVPVAVFPGGTPAIPRPTKFYLDIGRGASYDRVMEKEISATDTSILLSTALIESGTSIDTYGSMNPIQGRTFYPGDKIKLTTDSGETDFAIKGNLF